MTYRALIPSLVLITAAPLATAQVHFYSGDSGSLNCAGTFVDTVEVGADTITVETVFTANPVGDGYNWPTITQTATYADGHVLIDREFGGKLIDDAVPCDLWFQSGHDDVVNELRNAPLVAGLSEAYGSREIEEIRTCLADLPACEVNGEWRITPEVKALALDEFNRLIDGPARLFYLQESAYTGTSMLFDVEARRLIPIYHGGC